MLENSMVMDFGENERKKRILKCSICESYIEEYAYEVDNLIYCPNCIDEMKFFYEEE